MNNVSIKNLYKNPYRRKRKYIKMLPDNGEKLIYFQKILNLSLKKIYINNIQKTLYLIIKKNFIYLQKNF